MDPNSEHSNNETIIISNYSGDLICNHLKYGLFESQISNGVVFKWLGFSYGYSYNLNHSKNGPLEIQTTR